MLRACDVITEDIVKSKSRFKRNVTWYITIHCNNITYVIYVQAATGRRGENYKQIPDVIPYFWSGNDILLHEFCC